MDKPANFLLVFVTFIIIALVSVYLFAANTLGETAGTATPNALSPVDTHLDTPSIASEEPTQITPTPQATSTISGATADTPSGTPIISGTMYIVVEGDTLGVLATRFGTTVAAIVAANTLPDEDQISIGQQLIIPDTEETANPPTEVVTPSVTVTPTVQDSAETGPEQTTPSPTPDESAVQDIIGRSALNLPIELHTFGNGPINLVFVGGIHGGYEWNTVLLAYEVIDALTKSPGQIPDAITLYIIPAANPDGVLEATGVPGPFNSSDVQEKDLVAARFNGNAVDLNRNWDCNWQPTAQFRDMTVSGGAAPFSEPETVALRDFILGVDAQLVVFWHSVANMVIPGGCDNVIHEPSTQLARLYGDAAGYPFSQEFTAYPITGDASDWLTTQNIPSFTVELKAREDIELTKNLMGVLAILDHFAQKASTGVQPE